jgi:hypothetical protein
MSREFKTVVCTGIEPSKKEGWFRAHFTQEVISTGDETNPGGMGLESAMNAFKDTRTCYETVSAQTVEALGLAEGVELKGFNIARYHHEVPVSDNHKAGGNGKYQTTKLVKAGVQTDYNVDRKVSEQMYEDWKKNSKVATSAGSTAPSLIQTIPD